MQNNKILLQWALTVVVSQDTSKYNNYIIGWTAQEEEAES
jgi:hypothetical protein